MNRMLVALSAVCLPMLSVAAPPITEPVEVTVANPVLPVEVSNADPIPVTIAGEAQAPFSASAGIASPGGFASLRIDIPDGKRLIIETVAALARIPEGTSVVFNMLTRTVADNGSVTIRVFPIPVISQGLIPNAITPLLQQRYAGLHSVRISADAVGSEVDDLEIEVERSRVSGEVIINTSVGVTVSGYLVDR